MRYERVNEVAPLVVEIVQHLERGLFAALAHDAFPGVAKVHCSQAYRADVYSGCRGEYSVTA